MPLPIWTPAALASEFKPYGGRVWRLVEAQHHVSTRKLVDTQTEQDHIEALIDASKPMLPPGAEKLHYLLFTPFRYGSPYPKGSRFRRAGKTDGVFYASESVAAALAEIVFYRLLFFAEAPGLELPNAASDYTAFMVEVSTQSVLDLTATPFAAHAAVWGHLTDYEPCQALAEAAREASANLIRYESVRDPAKGANVALLHWNAFKVRRPAPGIQSWKIQLGLTESTAFCQFPKQALSFEFSEFSRDPRLKPLIKKR